MEKKHLFGYWKYWWMVIKDSFKDVFRESIKKIDKIVLLVLVTAMTVSIGITTWEALTQQFNLTSLYTSLAFFVASVIVAIYHKPPELQAEAEEKILLLHKDIEELKRRLDIKEYDDIEVTFRDDPLTDHQLGLLGHDSNNFLRLALRVTNNGGTSIKCGLRMVSLQYNRTGYIQSARWEGDNTPIDREDSPTPIERKLMKWDEGYATEGRVDISSNGGIGNLMFAETNSSGGFWFLYIDGKSRNQQVIQGKYWATLQLEGYCERDEKKFDLKPIRYEVEFIYTNKKLDPVAVRKIKA
jgi:hypothetical protein